MGQASTIWAPNFPSENIKLKFKVFGIIKGRDMITGNPIFAKPFFM